MTGYANNLFAGIVGVVLTVGLPGSCAVVAFLTFMGAI